MIHILCTDVSSADKDCYNRLYTNASPERKERADRCLRQEDKLRCVTAHALLQAVLKMEVYQIERNACGKPYVKGRNGFHYNLSHSGRYVVIAWGDSEVGVDVQQQNAAVNIDAIARRFFTRDEQDYIRGNLLRFYEIWTKKESYIKYTGEGLHRDLKSFSVLAPEPEIRYFYRTLEGGYSLSLCTKENDCAFQLLDVKRLL